MEAFAQEFINSQRLPTLGAVNNKSYLGASNQIEFCETEGPFDIMPTKK